MKKITPKFSYILLFFVLFISIHSYAHVNDTITDHKKQTLSLNSRLQKEVPPLTPFSISAPAESEFTSSFIQSHFPISAQTSNDLGKAMSTCEEIDKNMSLLTDFLEPKKAFGTAPGNQKNYWRHTIPFRHQQCQIYSGIH